MYTPFVAIGNGELDKNPEVHKGDLILCPHCGDTHPVILGKSQKWNEETQSVEEEFTETNALQMFKCDFTGNLYLCGVDNKAMDGIEVVR